MFRHRLLHFTGSSDQVGVCLIARVDVAFERVVLQEQNKESKLCFTVELNLGDYWHAHDNVHVDCCSGRELGRSQSG